ncbi:MAG: rod shape-determining protein MreD [Eubacteriales bacterium]|nr:rod shape-determining protein MreD [Eubacteriales bacterium]
MKSKIILFLTILCSFLLQSTVVHSISLGSISPNLILILVVSFGLMRGRKSGLWVGFFSGILIDIFYGYPFGFYALIYMYIGFFSGYAHRICYDDDLKVPVLLVTVSDFVYNIAVYGLQFLLRGRTGLFTYLYRIILPEVFYTAILTLIVYRVFHYINYHFLSAIRKESESIWVLK